MLPCLFASLHTPDSSLLFLLLSPSPEWKYTASHTHTHTFIQPQPRDAIAPLQADQATGVDNATISFLSCERNHACYDWLTKKKSRNLLLLLYLKFTLTLLFFYISHFCSHFPNLPYSERGFARDYQVILAFREKYCDFLLISLLLYKLFFRFDDYKTLQNKNTHAADATPILWIVKPIGYCVEAVNAPSPFKKQCKTDV